jgi:hypothetical protein
MLFGFELFSALGRGFNAEVIEVYPLAIVRALLVRASTSQRKGLSGSAFGRSSPCRLGPA